MVSCPQPAWDFFVIFFLLRRFVSHFFNLFSNPPPVFFGERSASLTFVPFHTLFHAI